MIRHIALFTFTDGITDRDVQTIDAALGTLPGTIEQIRSYKHGRDIGIGDGNWDYGVIGEFDSVEDGDDDECRDSPYGSIRHKDEDDSQKAVQESVEQFTRAALLPHFSGRGPPSISHI